MSTLGMRQIIAIGILILFAVPASAAEDSAAQRKYQDRASRLAHARELLGSGYQRSVVRDAEEITDLDNFVYKRTLQALKGKWKKSYREIASEILNQSSNYHFDPIFLMAIIQNESSFNPEIRGSHGEIGLLQILPTTAHWVSQRSGIRWLGSRSLYDPVFNIKIGAAYLAMLRERFDSHGRLYLSAYNMGSLNVDRALERDVWPREYAFRVMKRYLAFYRDLQDDE